MDVDDETEGSWEDIKLGPNGMYGYTFFIMISHNFELSIILLFLMFSDSD